VRFGLLTDEDQIKTSVANIAQLQSVQTAQVLSTPIVRLGEK